jgi:hypothetical protein
MNGVPTWNNMTIFFVIMAIVGFSMFMGQKSPRHGTRAGWWAGLVVLLIVLSAFFGTTILRTRSVQEVRHAGQVSWSSNVADKVKEQLREVKEQTEDAVDEAKRAMNHALKRDTGDRGRSRSRVEVRIPTPPAPPAMSLTGPLKEVTFEITLPNNERAQKLEQLDRKLKEKAAEQVTQWVREGVPYQKWLTPFITPEILEARGAFPEPVEPIVEEIPRDSQLPGFGKDPLYNGTLKVVLSPPLQEFLKNETFRAIDVRLSEHKLMQQGVVFTMLLINTLAAGVIGTLCYLHRVWKSPHTERVGDNAM